MMQKIEVADPFFLVRVPKKEQRERLEKIGKLYYPPEYVFMKRGMQCGEIVQIGKAAHEYFPYAEIGHILIFHHIVEGKQDKGHRFYWMGDDKNWNYYIVTAFSNNGERNMTFGVWDGENIIPNRDYIFLNLYVAPRTDLEEEVFKSDVKGLGDFATSVAFEKAGGGIVIAKERRQTREENVAKMAANTARVKELAKWMRFPDMINKVKGEMTSLEAENVRISEEINKVTVESYTVAGINPNFRDWAQETFLEDIQVGDTVFMKNIGCYMVIEFLQKEYVIGSTQYFEFPDSWIRKHIKKVLV